MPRMPRRQYAGAWHHVMNRGANRQATFLTANDRLAFLALLGEVVDQFGIEVHAYCLMTNHFHVLIRTPEPVLDTAMQRLIGGYTRHFNDRHERDGALFRGRYGSILVETERYLAALTRYIHRNPIAICGPKFPAYPWSSYPAYRGERPPEPWLELDFTLKQIGGRERYRGLVENDLVTDVDRLLSRPRPPRILSDDPEEGSDP